MPPVDVMFYEAFDEEAELLRLHLPAGIRANFTRATVQASGHLAPPAPLLSIRTQSVIPPDWLPRIKGILARTTGYDHLRAYRAASPHLPLACLPEYCTRAVAEQAILLGLALLRRLPRQIKQWPTFDRDGLTGRECEGRTLVVVGVGRIGHEVAKLGRGLGLNVIGVDPVQRHAEVRYLPWEQAAAAADVVIACMDLNETSRHYFNATSLAQVKQGALLVNVARGELTDPDAVVAALDQGRLAGWAADVFEEETRMADGLRGLAPLGPEHERLKAWAGRPDILFTPHNAFNTLEAVDRKSAFSAEQVSCFLTEGRFRWPWPG